jgi:hypothetical protein
MSEKRLHTSKHQKHIEPRISVSAPYEKLQRLKHEKHSSSSILSPFAANLTSYLSSNTTNVPNNKVVNTSKIADIVSRVYGPPPGTPASKSPVFDTSILTPEARHNLFIQEIVKCVTTTPKFPKVSPKEYRARTGKVVSNKVHTQLDRIFMPMRRMGLDASASVSHQPSGSGSRRVSLANTNHRIRSFSASSSSIRPFSAPIKPSRSNSLKRGKRSRANSSTAPLPEKPVAQRKSSAADRDGSNANEQNEEDDTDSIIDVEDIYGEYPVHRQLPLKLVRDVINILRQRQKRPLSKSETTKLFERLKKIPAFHNQDDFVLKELSKVVKLVKHEVDRAVFKQGDKG